MARVRLSETGVWCCRAYLGTSPATGRAQRPYRQFPEARSEAEAQALADEWERQLRRPHLAECLLRYAADVASMGAPGAGGGPKANTAHAYLGYARRLGEALPDLPPDQVGAADVTACYRRMLSPGGGRRGLSAATVAGYHWFLCGAWRWMVGQGLATSSPMGGVAHPTAGRGAGSARALSADERARLARALDEAEAAGPGADPALWVAAVAADVAMRTGMRCGEVCALRLLDYRREPLGLHACGTVTERGGARRQPAPKRDRPRWVALAAGDGEWLDALLAGRWGEDPEAPLVTADGSLTAPTRVGQGFARLREAAGLPRWAHFHTLRHTHATALLLGGADMVTVQERLGHASVATTLSLYGHVLPGRDAEVAERMSGILRPR